MFRRWTYFYVKMLPWMNWSKGTLVGGRFDLRYLSIDQVKRNPNRVFIKWSPQPLPLTSPRLFFPFTPHCEEMQLEYKTFWEETSYNHGEKLPFCPLSKITFSWHLKYWAHLFFEHLGNFAPIFRPTIVWHQFRWRVLAKKSYCWHMNFHFVKNIEEVLF